MKRLICYSCITLYLVANQVQISNSEPISLTLFSLFVSVLGIFGFIQSNIYLFLPTSPGGEIYKPSKFYDNLELIKNTELIINLSQEIKTMLNDISIRNELRPYKISVEHKIDGMNLRYEHVLPYKRAKLQGDSLANFDIQKLKEEASMNIGTGPGSVYDLIKGLHEDLIGREENNLVFFLLETMKENTVKTCSTQKEIASFQQSLDKLLSGIFITYMKAYFVIRFSEEFLNDHDMTKNVSLSISLNDTMTKLDKVMNNTIEGFKKEMSRSSRDVWICDPSVHEEGVTFETLAGNYHKQIVPQYVLDVSNYGPQNKNADGHCKRPCDSKPLERIPLWETDPNKRLAEWEIRERERYDFSYGSPYFISQPRTLYNCKSLRDELPITGDYSTRIHYYDYTDTPYKSGNMKFRQFQKLVVITQEKPIEYEPKNVSIPPTKVRVLENTGVWTKCDICACMAEESFMRYSTSQVIADKDHVITGVRILRNSTNTSLDKYIHFQIQQGKLLENGAIDNSTLNWKAIDYDALLTAPIERLHSYVTNTDMADIDLPPNKVLVGIGFETNSFGDGVKLKITARSFNFTTGKINHIDTSEHHPKVFQNVIDTENGELPDPKDKSTIVATNVSIKYSTSSFIKDLGQTTVPFLDIQNVTTSRPTPMGGAGLYYKYKEGHAGYIGIKLKTYDFLQNVNDNPLSVKEAAKRIYDQLLKEVDVQDDTRVLFN